MKLVLVIVAMCAIGAHAVCPNGCSGHGACNSYDTCECQKEGKTTYFGYSKDTAKGFKRVQDKELTGGRVLSAGATAQMLKKNAFSQAQWTGADCSLKTCSRGVSWTKAHPKTGSKATGKNANCVDMAGDGEGAVLHMDFAECSDAGLCNRDTGVCECFVGYEGSACQRTSCVNDCSNHGTCQSNIKFSEDGSIAGSDHSYLNAWDSGIHYGCKCDAGYRGYDCSQKECPSESDPLGHKGNSQGKDCSNRGICDYTSGLCQCFRGYTGVACSKIEALV